MENEVKTPNSKVPRRADPVRGKRLLDAIQESGLTQAEVARRVKVNAQSMWKLTSGRGMPSDVTLEKLCRELRISPEWFLFGRGEKRATRVELGASGFSVPTREALHPGLRQWLSGTPEGRSATTEERAWLRSLPWPDPSERAPDRAYELMLEGYRAMRADGVSGPSSRGAMVHRGGGMRSGGLRRARRES